MKKIFNNFLFVLMMLMSYGITAQPTVELVCLELNVNGEISVIAVTANILDETQTALEEQGISSTVVECEGDFELPGDIGDIDWDPTESGDIDPVDLVCLELISGTDTSIIALTANLLDETQAALEEQGISSTVVECEDDFEFPGDIGDIDWDPTGSGETDPVDLVCLEISSEFGTSVIAVTANILEETQAALEEQGYVSIVVECEDDFEFPGDIGDIDWDPSGHCDIEFEDLVCLEITTDAGTSVIAVTANILEETQAALEEQGITSTVIECDGDFEFPGDIGDIDWDPTENDDIDFGDFVCLELDANGEISVIGVTANIVEQTQAVLAEQGITSTIIECDDDFELPGNNPFDNDGDTDFGYNSIDIYPNPANTQDVININFSSNREEIVTLNVFNQFGQMITSDQLNTYKGKNAIELNSSKLESGFYIISLTNGKEVNLTEKLLIVK